MKDTYLVVVGEDAQRGRYQALAEDRTHGKVVFVGRRDETWRAITAQQIYWRCRPSKKLLAMWF